MAAKDILIPDLGGATAVDVIEILVSPGDKVEKEDSLVTLEGDKASMDVPAPFSGVVKAIKMKIGDKVSENDLLLTMDIEEEEAKEEPKAATKVPAAASTAPVPQAPTVTIEKTERPLTEGLDIHAGPAVRRIAREFGIDLKKVRATGRKGRILKEDIQNYVKSVVAGGQAGAMATATGLQVPPAPVIDFSKFGEIETQPLTKIKRFTGVNTHRSWVTVPHVTQFDEADITEMEAFRKNNKAKAEKAGYKLTPLAFLMKAVAIALREMPTFNASLDASGNNLLLKKYFNIGVAVDTPNGLVVPVIREVDKKSLYELAEELKAISAKARDKGLSLNEMQGSCFTISSLGGIGGTAFTPIINTPDVAILGVSKSQVKPIYKDGEFEGRLMLPLSLSYDHRVIDGAQAARFTKLLGELLTDIRQLLL